MATVQGRTKRERQGLKSTKHCSQPIDPDILDDSFPISDAPNVKTNEVAFAILDPTTTSKAYFDLTGRFPHRSFQGNQYIMVSYHYDANSILAEPLRDRTAASLTQAWKKFHDVYASAGVAPTVYVMDNEFSNDLKQAFDKHSITYQKVPPHSHRNNLAERAIQTYKNHFKAGLASCDPNFPLSLWDQLLHQ